MKINRKIFFAEYRKRLDKDGRLEQSEVSAIDKFLDLYESHCSYFELNQWAYVFATVFHETRYTFLPVREAFWLSENWRKRNLRYWPYYGRGFVQITWKSNYEKFSKLLGIDFVRNPDKVMEVDYSFFIIIKGFKDGLFTGRKLSRYVQGGRKDYKSARRCINGSDKAYLIAKYAEQFEYILKKSI